MADKLDQFAVCAQEICRHFMSGTPVATRPLGEFLFNLDGVCVSIQQTNNENNPVIMDHLTIGGVGPSNRSPTNLQQQTNKLFKNIHVSIEKYESYIQFKKMLNDAKVNFELAQTRTLEATVESDIYASIMSLMNEAIRLDDNDDMISSFLYRSPNTSSIDPSTDRIPHETSSLNSLSLHATAAKLSTPPPNSSNYLLSFFEYCKTLYEYFREKSSSHEQQHSSCFSILTYSPASLICKLLFQDGIKPSIIESLTQKLNLNLTAIILHNSCPRLKLTTVTTIGAGGAAVVAASGGAARSIAGSLLTHQMSHTSSTQSMQYAKQTSQGPCERRLTVLNATPWSPADAQIYNLDAFYLVLNQSDIIYCSRKKPDEFVRDLLFKVSFKISNEI